MPDNKERIKQITDSIEQGIKELFESDKYRSYLQTMSRFHRYSLNNVMLIHSQMPNATHVAGFNRWKDQFGRHVKKGERGIQIIAPTPFKKKVEEIMLDPDTNAPMLDKDGNAVMEEKEIKIPMFKVVSVFDVSQTEGKPLPELASELSGDVKQYEVFMEALRRTASVPISFKPLPSDTDGYFSLSNQSITIREGMSEVQTVSALIHEIAHSKLHNTNMEGDEKKDRRTEEVEAESISYAVCQYYGIETGENSLGYIAAWSKNKELKELKASLETINKTSSGLITDIDRNFAEICKERGITQKEEEIEEAEPVLTAERLYTVDDNKYLHVQRCDEGIDYTLYDMETKKELDGGQLDSQVELISEATLEICKLHNIGNDAPIRLADISVLGELQDAEVKSWEAGSNIETSGIQPEAPVVPAEMLPDSPGQNRDEPMPDPEISMGTMQGFGYTDEEMLPLSKDRALELAERDVTVYLLYGDNTEAMALDDREIIEHDGLFGIAREDWDAVKADIPARDIEKRFIQDPEDGILIYQLKDSAPAALLFSPYNTLWEVPNAESYKAVYTQPLYDGGSKGEVLEKAYEQFNIQLPPDFTGHSLSVSDVIAIKRGSEITYHYCDTIGFKELEQFKPENYLKAAEMAMEDDYAMIDGIINNGARQEHENRPSVLEKLKSLPAQEYKKTAPKHSAERDL